MAPPLTVTLLGTGTSTGVPVIGCACPTCTSADPRDRRLRTSAHVVAHTPVGPVHLQIDAGPDFRAQALRAALPTVDAVLITHEHFDHVVGLDDLRPFFFQDRTPIPVHAAPRTAAALADMFSYIFRDGSYPGSSRLELHEAREPFLVRSRSLPGAQVQVAPVPALHGRLPVLGFRVGHLAYLTDISHLPDASLPLLDGVRTLVLDGLRAETHPTHLSFTDAAAVAARVGARETWLVHMTHTVRHAEVDLPDGLQLAYDGLVLSVEGD
jgi:phosphoribosyl 1,2-cyclic phosphate phosphodiesterase